MSTYFNFKRMVSISVSFLVLIGIFTSQSYAAAPPQQFNWVMVRPSKAIDPLCVKTQQKFYQYIKRTIPWVLSTSENFGISRNFRYQGVSYAKNPPHISLFQVPVNSGYAPNELIALLRRALNAPDTVVPRTFKFDHLEAFLPAAGSQRLWIVARTPSTIPRGFFNLTEQIQRYLSIPRVYSYFRSHISIGHIDKAVTAGPWQSHEITAVERVLQKFGRLSTEAFQVNDIVLSFHYSLGRSPVVLWRPKPTPKPAPKKPAPKPAPRKPAPKKSPSRKPAPKKPVRKPVLKKKPAAKPAGRATKKVRKLAKSAAIKLKLRGRKPVKPRKRVKLVRKQVRRPAAKKHSTPKRKIFIKVKKKR